MLREKSYGIYEGSRNRKKKKENREGMILYPGERRLGAKRAKRAKRERERQKRPGVLHFSTTSRKRRMTSVMFSFTLASYTTASRVLPYDALREAVVFAVGATLQEGRTGLCMCAFSIGELEEPLCMLLIRYAEGRTRTNVHTCDVFFTQT